MQEQVSRNPDGSVTLMRHGSLPSAYPVGDERFPLRRTSVDPTGLHTGIYARV